VLAAASDEFTGTFDYGPRAQRSGAQDVFIRSALLDDAGRRLSRGLPEGPLISQPAHIREHPRRSLDGLRKTVAARGVFGYSPMACAQRVTRLGTSSDTARGIAQFDTKRSATYFGAHGFERRRYRGAHHGTVNALFWGVTRGLLLPQCSTARKGQSVLASHMADSKARCGVDTAPAAVRSAASRNLLTFIGAKEPRADTL